MKQATQLDLFTGEACLITADKDPTKSGLEDMEDRMMERYCQKVSAVIDRLDDIGLPAPGVQYRLVTRRNFNAVELIQYICRKHVIEHLAMAIYSINYEAARILMQLVRRGRIKKMEILMSNLRNKGHREKERLTRDMFMRDDRVSLFFCSSHAKTMACSTDDGNYYSIEGSGNLAYNSRVEQYIIDNDKHVFDFHLRWMREIREYLDEKGSKELEVC